MKKQISIIAVALLAALPITSYASNCNTANDSKVCVNLSCSSHIIASEKAKDIINSILSGDKIDFSSDIAEIIDKWIKEQTDNLPDFKPTPPENTPENAPDQDTPTEKPETENVPEQLPPVQNGNPSEDNSVSGSIENASFVKEVIRLVNIERNKAGLASLKEDSNLNKASSTRANEIVRSFSHTRPDGRSCFTALSDIGYSYSSAGENIAYGQNSPSAVVNAWMNSEGHRKNILGAQFSKIGVGCHNNGGTLYWAQFFAG